MDHVANEWIFRAHTPQLSTNILFYNCLSSWPQTQDLPTSQPWDYKPGSFDSFKLYFHDSRNSQIFPNVTACLLFRMAAAGGGPNILTWCFSIAHSSPRSAQHYTSHPYGNLQTITKTCKHKVQFLKSSLEKLLWMQPN